VKRMGTERRRKIVVWGPLSALWKEREGGWEKTTGERSEGVTSEGGINVLARKQDGKNFMFGGFGGGGEKGKIRGRRYSIISLGSPRREGGGGEKRNSGRHHKKKNKKKKTHKLSKKRWGAGISGEKHQVLPPRRSAGRGDMMWTHRAKNNTTGGKASASGSARRKSLKQGKNKEKRRKKRGWGSKKPGVNLCKGCPKPSLDGETPLLCVELSGMLGRETRERRKKRKRLSILRRDASGDRKGEENTFWSSSKSQLYQKKEGLEYSTTNRKKKRGS